MRQTGQEIHMSEVNRSSVCAEQDFFQCGFLHFIVYCQFPTDTYSVFGLESLVGKSIDISSL